MSDPTLFLATPLGTPQVHYGYLNGAMAAVSAFHGRLMFSAQMGSFLPRNRDALTRDFLKSSCSHMLCVDSDIGWKPEQAQQLLDLDQQFVGGIYCIKHPSLVIPTRLVHPGDQSDVVEVEYLPAGFLLLQRSCVEEMVAAYPELAYDYGHALWSYQFQRGVSYDQEDVAFCRRWRALGKPIWLHRQVVVTHFGDIGYRPNAASWERLK